MTTQTKTSISLSDGDFFDFNNPEANSFDINVIAHSLSNLCRYTGHSSRFYSVAEHSVLVSLLVPEHLALCGLLHDASEAFCGDVASPLKKLIPDYCKIEDRVQGAIASRYNLPYPFPPAIHTADKIVYVTERVSLTNVDDTMWHTEFTPSTDITVVGYRPSAAKAIFLNRFYSLMDKKEAA